MRVRSGSRFSRPCFNRNFSGKPIPLIQGHRLWSLLRDCPASVWGVMFVPLKKHNPQVFHHGFWFPDILKQFSFKLTLLKDAWLLHRGTNKCWFESMTSMGEGCSSSYHYLEKKKITISKLNLSSASDKPGILALSIHRSQRINTLADIIQI